MQLGISLKSYLYPNKQKIVFTCILIVISYFSFIASIAVSSAIPHNDVYCIGSQTETIHPGFFTFTFAPFAVIFFGKICNHLSLVIINIPYLYLIACIVDRVFAKSSTS